MCTVGDTGQDGAEAACDQWSLNSGPQEMLLLANKMLYNIASKVISCSERSQSGTKYCLYYVIIGGSGVTIVGLLLYDQWEYHTYNC